MTENIGSHTIAFTTEADGGGLASGTTVSIGNRLLVATVAHALTDDNSRIGLVGKNRVLLGDRSRWVIKQAKHSDANIDVGVIELDRTAISDLGLTALLLDRVIDAGPGKPVLKTRVIGFPWDSRLDDVIERGVRSFVALSYGCETVHSAAWGGIYTSNLGPDLHLLAHYERQDNIDWKGDHLESVAAPNPHGMSGGGYWQRDRWLPDSAIWQPTDLCLCGVQSAFLPKRSLIKGVQIIHWLKLVSEVFPDLAKEIEGRFPRVKTLA